MTAMTGVSPVAHAAREVALDAKAEGIHVTCPGTTAGGASSASASIELRCPAPIARHAFSTLGGGSELDTRVGITFGARLFAERDGPLDVRSNAMATAVRGGQSGAALGSAGVARLPEQLDGALGVCRDAFAREQADGPAGTRGRVARRTRSTVVSRRERRVGRRFESHAVALPEVKARPRMTCLAGLLHDRPCATRVVPSRQESDRDAAVAIASITTTTPGAHGVVDASLLAAERQVGEKAAGPTPPFIAGRSHSWPHARHRVVAPGDVHGRGELAGVGVATRATFSRVRLHRGKRRLTTGRLEPGRFVASHHDPHRTRHQVRDSLRVRDRRHDYCESQGGGEQANLSSHLRDCTPAVADRSGPE